MKILIISTVIILLFQSYSCEDNFNKLFEKINNVFKKFNSVAAKITWESSMNPSRPDLLNRAANYQKREIVWQHKACDKLTTLKNSHLLNYTEERQTYLLCRGPVFTYYEARQISTLYEELETVYSEAEVCVPTNKNISTSNLEDIEEAILNHLSSDKQISKLERNLSTEFSTKMAVDENNIKLNMICLKGESDFDKLMMFSNNEEILKWLWLVWRDRVGPPMREPYRRLVTVENHAARRNGYANIGVFWRDELEIPNLRHVSRKLYESIRPLYSLLHGVVRFFLRNNYGDVVPKRGAIPAHLLGNLWGQNWESLAELITPTSLNLDESIKKMNWTVSHMVKRAEDFYQSLGLPAMTDTFWRESVFTRENHDATRCHGAAADMFQSGDYRLLYCSGTSVQDFYVLHHELGHIHYYMAYENQPAIFRQANSALHESIGDTIMYGVMTPQHLYRLGLINDTLLYTVNKPENIEYSSDYYTNDEINNRKYINKNNYKEVNENKNSKKDNTDISAKFKVSSDESKKINEVRSINDETLVKEVEINTKSDQVNDISTDDIILLKQALNKLPQIPFAYMIDEYRWRYFEGSLKFNELNKEFWDMTFELQGIAPPEERREEYFDVGAYFHVPDNTPYIRYFLSSFLQHQLFEHLCKAAVFGRRDVTDPLPETISLHRCDIYGSKAAGKLLKDIMSRGNSQHWREILQETIGENVISPLPLKRYYRPLHNLLTRLVDKYNIPIGW